ncbi:MAG: tryptophan--tRNA ligase [Christensenellales bacterium]
MKEIILTGDRPTGKLHLGHLVGSLKNRIELQNTDKYEMYIMIADTQALTDNAGNVQKVTDNILQVTLDYLSAGIDADKTTIFIQSQVSELTEISMYYMNLVTLARLQRNPTVKTEIKQKNFGQSIPVGFLTYPISQASDITAFEATLVPVGHDQLPMIEQTREIVRTFNNLYGETLVEPKEMLPNNKACLRLPGLDGKAKMSKSLGNCIYLSDSKEEIERKVKLMYTDPNHIRVEDPGQVKGNIVFTYLDAFCENEHFDKYLPEYKNLDDLKAHYKKGGVGDMKIKKFLINILEEKLAPIRQRRAELEKEPEKVYEILRKGSEKAKEKAHKTLIKIKNAMGINYFNEQ